MSSCEGNFGSCSGSDSGNIFKKWLSDEKYSRAESSFNTLRDEVKAVAKNEEEAQSLMEHEVLKGLISSRPRKVLAPDQLSQFFECLDFAMAPHATETKTQDFGEKKPTESLVNWVTKKPRAQTKNPRMKEQAGADPSADMPTEFKKRVMELQGRDVKMLMERKEIFATDLEPRANRLLISRMLPSDEFLTKEEQAKIVRIKKGGRFEGLSADLIEPSLKESKILLKKWRLGGGFSYALSSEWISVAERNRLAVGDVIQLWSFRVGGSLWFALTKLND